ncbi:unnamed protein product [Paramecium sonneborni]|uniref:Uncharacterized protein n=1 Tax=Paramecium sonneborni TaxID=65129 RepID=A0A8S1RQH6_9CILI|nr:unnamed protein product [Paramecium sonneborni]
MMLFKKDSKLINYPNNEYENNQKKNNSRKKKDEHENKEIVESELPQFNFNTLNPEKQKIVIGMITDQLSAI